MQIIETIILNTCHDCIYCDHSGSFTPGGAKPVCHHPVKIKETGADWHDRVIPYETKDETIPLRSGDRITPMHYVKEIPQWCPLRRGEPYFIK
jgi:hypothetical protein